MPLVIVVFSVLWAAVMLKEFLFWLWLWQLKEYHWRRFLAHFSTVKGQALIFNYRLLTKLAMIVLLFFWQDLAVAGLFLIFGLELGLFLSRGLKRNVQLPNFTLRAIITLGDALIVLAAGFWLAITFLTQPIFYFWLTVANITTPIIFSVMIFSFEPIAELWRRKLLLQAASKIAARKNLIVVAITGSYGKTSTKEFLATILTSRFRVLKTPGHINAEVGIAQTILKELKDQDIFIAEIGAYDRGKVKQVCEIIRPKIGIATGVNEQHLATFGSMENLMAAEGGGELMESLGGRGVLIQNSKVKMQNENSKCKIIRYSVEEKVNIRAEDIKVGKEWLKFKVQINQGEAAAFEVNLVGQHNIENLLAAAAAANEVGMSLAEIAQAARSIKPEQGAMVIKKGRNSVDIIDASYSANPAGVISALEHLKLWPGKKVIIMPCLIELGSAAAKVHQEIGQKIAVVCDFAIITTADYFKELKDSALSKGMNAEQVLHIEEPLEIARRLQQFFAPENVILLEGRVSAAIAEKLAL